MTACRTHNGLSAGFQDKNSQPGAFLSEAEEGHMEEGCVEPLQEGCDHDTL